MLRQISTKTAEAWLASGAIKLIETGEENSYYKDEWGYVFFCKNYPVEQAVYSVEE